MKSVKILLISIITIFLSSLAHAELNINRVITSVEGSGKWITVRASFYNVDSDNVTEIFRMGIDGNLENGYFHALRFDERSFRIPKEYSFESQPGRFFFADFSVNSGAFRNLYNYLDTKNQANIEAACNYMNNSKVIDKTLKTKSINNAHGPFLANQKTKKSLSYLLNLCVKTSAKVYVVDVQNYLTALGIDVGKVDGKWGKKTELGLAKFQTDRGLEVKTAVSSNLLRMMKADVIDKEIKFSTLTASPQYFDKDGKLVGKYSKKISIAQKLKNRKTINPFKAWDSPGTFGDVYDKHYGLYWTLEANAPSPTLRLNEIKWAFNYPNFPYDDYPGVQKFILNTPWGHDAEYGETYAIDLNRSDYAEYMARVAYASINANKADGIMLDWWHDEHPTTLTQNQIRKAREKLLIEYRKLDNNKTIILGNVNDRTDLKFAKLTNGVFLEHWKKPFKQYSSNQLFKMEKTLEFFDKNLLEPKIVAFNAWKKSERDMSSRLNRQSDNNRRYAKLFTAMSVVVPENGYILFGDNNQDEPDGDHNHDYYDFYSFDIGKPISGFNKVRSGVGYKEHDKGFIAYNITGSSKKFKRKNGQEHTIQAKSGLFCKYVGAKTECLSNN